MDSREERFLAALRHSRSVWRLSEKPARLEIPGPGQESVWDYPRPPAVEAVTDRLRVDFAGATIAETTEGRRIVETASAPVYYFPPKCVDVQKLVRTTRSTFCEWKGACVYFDIVDGGRKAPEAAYCYPDPLDDLGQGYAEVAGWYAFYPARVDACYVGDEQAAPQPGGYYAGWVTSKITGPIKGAPGSERW